MQRYSNYFPPYFTCRKIFRRSDILIHLKFNNERINSSNLKRDLGLCKNYFISLCNRKNTPLQAVCMTVICDVAFSLISLACSIQTAVFSQINIIISITFLCSILKQTYMPLNSNIIHWNFIDIVSMSLMCITFLKFLKNVLNIFLRTSRSYILHGNMFLLIGKETLLLVFISQIQ